MSNSQMLKLNSGDFMRGLATAVFAAVVMTLYGAVTQAGFDVLSADWSAILSSALNASIAAFFGYISKNLLTDDSGKIFGKF